MPLYDESGKAIITPKTRKEYQEKKETSKPTTTTTRTTSSTTTARRRRLEHTQEFESPSELEPIPGPVITSGQQLRIQAIKELGGIVEQYKGIDTGATYVYESGEQISGRELKQQMARDIKQYLLGTTKIKPGMYIESDEQHYRVTGETRYLIEHAEPKEKAELISSFGKTGYEGLPSDFVGPVRSRIYEATQKAYGSLTEYEKEEYGYTYKPFLDQPVGEWKYHPGGKRYIESLSPKQQEQLLTDYMGSESWTRYIESTKGVKERQATAMSLHELQVREPAILIPGWFNPFGGDIKQPQWMANLNVSALAVYDYPAAERSIARKQIISDGGVFSTLGFRTRMGYSYAESMLSATLFPVTLTQTAVKYVTGEGGYTDPFSRIKSGKTFLPDIGRVLAEGKITPTKGVLSGSIETIITGGKSDYLSTVMKYPWESGSASMGEFMGLYLGGKAIHVGKVGAAGRLGLKHTVRYTPKAIGKLKEFKGITYHLKPGGIPQPISTFSTRVGQTSAWKNLYGWSSGKLVKVRLLPKASQIFYKGSRTGVQEGHFNIFGKVTKYRGWGKTEWMPKHIAGHTKIGEFTTHTHKFVSDMYRGQPVVTSGKRLQIFETDIFSKPKGFLWWKRAKVQSVSLRETERYGTNIQKFLLGAEPSEKYGSFIRYWSGQSPLNLGKEVTGGGWIRYDPLKTIKKPIKYWYDEASASLVRPVHPSSYHPMMTGGMHGMGSLSGTSIVDFIAFPTAKFTLPAIFTMTGLALGAKVVEGMSSAQSLFPVSVQTVIPLSISKQIQQPSFDTRNLTRTIEEEMSASVLAEDVMYRQMQLQEQLTVSSQDYVSAFASRDISIVSPKLTSRSRVKLPFLPIPFYSSDAESMMRGKGKAGYNVLVKERYIFGGVKKKAGDFIRVNKGPLSRKDALSLGGSTVDNSAAASFRIMSANAPAGSLGIRVKRWKRFQHKFYRKKDGTYVEKTTNRIDTPGEEAGISALGWIAQQERVKTKVVREIRQPMVNEVDNYVKEIYDSFMPFQGPSKKKIGDLLGF